MLNEFPTKPGLLMNFSEFFGDVCFHIASITGTEMGIAGEGQVSCNCGLRWAKL